MVPPRRAADGFPLQRMLLICAVLEKRTRTRLATRDVYLNIVGGLSAAEPATDLAVAVSIASSARGQLVRPAAAFVGEVGLGGELRGARRLELRVQEAARLGFRTIIVPQTKGSEKSLRRLQQQIGSGVELIPCKTLAEALQHGLLVAPKSSSKGTPSADGAI